MTKPSPASEASGEARGERGGTVFVAVLALAGITVSLMHTLVIPLIPQLPQLLRTTPTDATWAITAALLAGAVSTPVVGRLADMFGRRRMLLISLAVLVAGSVIGALSDTLVPLVIGRALQGMASAVIPLGIAIMRDNLPPERLGSATALMSASLGVGGALGLPLASLVAEHADWHVLFWASAGLGALAAVLVATIVPNSGARGGGRFDFLGAALLSTALLCLLLAISKGALWGWGSALTCGLFVVAAVALAVWGWWELRTGQPLVDLRVSGRRPVLLTNTASAVFGFSMFAMSLVLPQLLQLPAETGYGLGQSILAAGLVMGPSGLVMMAMAPVCARISRVKGPKVTLMIGAGVVATGYTVAIFALTGVLQVVLVSALIGAGVGLSYGAMPALITAAVPVSQTAAANSLNSLMRAIGTSVASAVAGVVLAQMTTPFGPLSVPSQDGFRVVLALGAVTALVAVGIAAFIPGRAIAATTGARDEPAAQLTAPGGRPPR